MVIGALSVIAVIYRMFQYAVNRYNWKFTIIPSNISIDIVSLGRKLINTLATNLPLQLTVLIAFQFVLYITIGVVEKSVFNLVPLSVLSVFPVACSSEVFERVKFEVPVGPDSPGISNFSEYRDNVFMVRNNSLLNTHMSLVYPPSITGPKDPYALVQKVLFGKVSRLIHWPTGTVMFSAFPLLSINFAPFPDPTPSWTSTVAIQGCVAIFVLMVSSVKYLNQRYNWQLENVYNIMPQKITRFFQLLWSSTIEWDPWSIMVTLASQYIIYLIAFYYVGPDAVKADVPSPA